MCVKFQGPPANGASLDMFLMKFSLIPCQMVYIAEKIGVFLARGTGPTEQRPKKKNWDILIFISEYNQTYHTYCLVMIVLILLCVSRVTELQSYKHPRVPSIQVGDIFLCLISINYPTRFARRGIIYIAKPMLCHSRNLIIACFDSNML